MISQRMVMQFRVGNKQQGVVLFFALIALVVMMLAAVALIRSVDTDTSVAGNLAFKQAATISADAGIETAFKILKTGGIDKEVNSTANAALGYYATSEERNLTGKLAQPDAFSWDNSNSALAEGTDMENGKDSSGNTVRFVVERMCHRAGSTSPADCLSGQSEGTGAKDPNKPCYGKCLKPQPVFSPIYRITARVQGPKNTISYVQAYLY